MAPRTSTDFLRAARTGSDGPITSAEFVVGGQVFMGYNGGSHFTFSEGFSLFVDCEDQAEVDKYWDKLVKAGLLELRESKPYITTRGKEAGGEFRMSPKFGPYFLWPDSLKV